VIIVTFKIRLVLIKINLIVAAAEDDSDMLMEPDELPPPQYSVVRSESRVVPINRQFIATPTRFSGGFVPMISPRSSYASVSRVENYEPRVVARSESYNPNQEAAEQNFFPAFFRTTQTTANSHSRPYKTSSSSNAASIVGRYSASGRAQNFDQSILGSGDFAVIRGGTFYPDEDKNSQRYSSDEFFSGFYNNGHGRPSAQSLKTKKPAYYPEDPFEHFTDFADINTGNDGAFSHYSVIYANKNTTKTSPHPSPKNIFEQLQLLDLEKEEENKKKKESVKEIVEDKKLKKLSKFKTKLAKAKVVKKYKKNLGPKAIDTDYIDPLIATS
jgi:hypothetical protein